MFFFLPIGHDRSVHGYPWATFVVIALCTLVFGASALAERQAAHAADEAMHEVERVLSVYPDARIDWTVEGLPDEVIWEFFDPLHDPTMTEYGEGDIALDAAMHDLVTALNGLPNLRYGYRPGAPSLGTLFSHMFMHADFGHLFGNMVFLFLAGSVIESFWRRGPFLLLFGVAGLAGAWMHHAFNPGSMTTLIGASGAISGLLGAFVIGHPGTGIRIGYVIWILIRVLVGSWTVPAWVVIPGWAAMQIGWALLGSADGVAYWAHVGGFMVGVSAALLMHRFDWIVDHGDDLERDYTLETGGRAGLAPSLAPAYAPAPPQRRRPPALESIPLEFDSPSADEEQDLAATAPSDPIEFIDAGLLPEPGPLSPPEAPQDREVEPAPSDWFDDGLFIEPEEP